MQQYQRLHGKAACSLASQTPLLPLSDLPGPKGYKGIRIKLSCWHFKTCSKDHEVLHSCLTTGYTSLACSALLQKGLADQAALGCHGEQLEQAGVQPVVGDGGVVSAGT